VHEVKASGWMEVYIHSFFILALIEGEWSASRSKATLFVEHTKKKTCVDVSVRLAVTNGQ